MAHSEAHPPHLAGNELWLMDYLAGQLFAEQTQAMAAHLAACPECRALAGQWQQLEAGLESGLIGGYFLFHWLLGRLATSARAGAGSVPPGLVSVALVFSLLILAVGVGFSAKHQLARWLNEL